VGTRDGLEAVAKAKIPARIGNRTMGVHFSQPLYWRTPIIKVVLVAAKTALQVKILVAIVE
jgi:hypothetical protein